MSKTEICWATDSWNPITGCSHAGSPGCDNCYARAMAKRLAGRYGYPESPHEFDVTFHPDKLEEPLRWRKPRVVFVCSMGDLFHEGVEWEWLDKVYAAMAIAANHVFLVLTKRPRRAQEYLFADRGHLRNTADRVDEATADEFDYWDAEPLMFTDPWPPRHIWHGVSVETQDQMWRVEELLKIPAAKHFVSCEPLLGRVDLSDYLGQLMGCDIHGLVPRSKWTTIKTCGLCMEERSISAGDAPLMTRGASMGLDGVVGGGESGPGARPMHPDWARSIRDQCLAAGVPFTFKQWGGWRPVTQREAMESSRPWSDYRYVAQNPSDPHNCGTLCAVERRGKKAAGRELDGKVWNQWPWDLIDA